VGGVVPILAISGLIDHQDPTLIGRRRWIFAQQAQPLGLHLALVPARFGEKPLQSLRSRQLRPHQWFGIGQSCQRLMSFGGQKQALQVATKPFTLVALPQQVIKVPGIGFQRLGSRDNIDSLRHLTFLLSPYCITLSPLSTKYR